MMEALAAGLFGLLIGSFLNVCIFRLPRDLSVVRPVRSFCPGCEKTIAWYDNIPLLSYALLGGRCRFCRESIPARYPLVEAITGLLFFTVVYYRGWNLAGLKLCVFAAIMVDLIFTDMEERILPDEFTLGGAAVGLILAAFSPPASNLAVLVAPADWPVWTHGVVEGALGAGVSAGMLWLVGAVYMRLRDREGLGLGDVKMMLTIGAFLGLPGALLTVFAGSVVGAIGGALFIWLARRDMGYELPFGSFLGAAALFGAIFGDPILSWYRG